MYYTLEQMAERTAQKYIPHHAWIALSEEQRKEAISPILNAMMDGIRAYKKAPEHEQKRF